MEPTTAAEIWKLTLLSVSGGLLVALALINIVSAQMKERIRRTLRRTLNKKR